MAGFHLVSRLRNDADLYYTFKGKQKDGRGRPKKYDGKINFKNLKSEQVKLVYESESEKIYFLRSILQINETTTQHSSDFN
jgi:hypothetical protein